MKLKDLFKKSQKEGKTGQSSESLPESPASSVPASSEAIKDFAAPGSHLFSYQILVHPLVTEKASRLEVLGQYVFRVWPKANQRQIRQAVEKLYQVKVREVRIINLPAKKRKLGRWEGHKPGYKKAIIKLQAGYKIESAK